MGILCEHMYVHYMRVVPPDVRVTSEPLELELQGTLSCHVWCWELNPGPLQEQGMLNC